LADFVLDFTLIASKKFKTPVLGTHSQKEWNMSWIGLDGDQHAQVWEEINESPNFWMRLKSLCTPEELSALDTLCHDTDSAVHFITARCGVEPEEQTHNWLRSFGVCAEAIHVVRSPLDKPELAKALGVCVAIDDHPETCDGYAKLEIPNVFLMRRQYNAQFADSSPQGIKVVGSMIEFIYYDCLRRGVFDLPEPDAA
jgi:hypothetical protein